MRYFSCLLLSLFVFPSFAQSEIESCTESTCLIVVDAGSTGSRPHVYQYKQEDGKLSINELHAKKHKPGIASYVKSTKEIAGYLDRVFEEIKPTVALPVYFNATAGMRLLSSTQQQEIYAAITQWFEKQNQYHLVEAKTITGKQEGIYAWLTVNDQVGSNNLLGVMDMGGASVQIAFPINNVANIDPDDIAKINYKGKDVSLFVHSFLGLGQNEAKHQFLNESSCYPLQYPLSNGKLAHGKAKKCEKMVSVLVNRVHHVKKVVKRAMRVAVTNDWYVLGGLNFITEAEPFQLNRAFHMDSLLKIADNSICHTNWNSIVNTFTANDYLYTYCFSPAYYHALVVKGYGLSDQQVLNRMAPEKTDDWTLGAALYHINNKNNS